MSNARIKGAGASYAARGKQWAAFDALPRSVREALANAAFDWAPYPINRAWQRGQWKNAQALCKAIQQWDEKYNRKGVRGK